MGRYKAFVRSSGGLQDPNRFQASGVWYQSCFRFVQSSWCSALDQEAAVNLGESKPATPEEEAHLKLRSLSTVFSVFRTQSPQADRTRCTGRCCKHPPLQNLWQRRSAGSASRRGRRPRPRNRRTGRALGLRR